MLAVVDENDHHVSCKHVGWVRTARLCGLWAAWTHRFVGGVRVGADEVNLHAPVEHARLRLRHRPVPLEEKPGVWEEAHLERRAELLVELAVERRLAREEVDRGRAVVGKLRVGGDDGLRALLLEELLHHPDLRRDIERQSCAKHGPESVPIEA